MMTRIPVSLPPEQHRRAKARATELGVSFGEYVRRLIARDLGSPPAGDVSAIFDLGASAGSDVARFKDDYIGEAVEAEYERETGRGQ